MPLTRSSNSGKANDKPRDCEDLTNEFESKSSQPINVDQSVTEIDEAEDDLWDKQRRKDTVSEPKIADNQSNSGTYLSYAENTVFKRFLDIDDQIRNLEAKFLDKVDVLSNDFNDFKQSLMTEDSKRYTNALENENGRLKEQNLLLTDKLNTVSYIVSDLNTKIKDLEDEKASLVTTIKIINDEYSRGNSKADTPKESQSTQSTLALKTNISKNQASQSRSIEVPSTDDDDGESISVPEEITNKKKKKTKKSAMTKNASVGAMPQNPPMQENVNENQDANLQNEKFKKKTTIIAGDSIVKNIQGWRLSDSNNHVVVKSFSGSTISDMEDYLKPIIRREPSKIILHVGTNDINHLTAQQIAKGVANLGTQISQDSPRTKVALSGILPRTDKPGLSSKIKATNDMIKSFCQHNKWDFLDHKSIDPSCLNARGLHLNRKGTTVVAKNITDYISN